MTLPKQLQGLPAGSQELVELLELSGLQGVEFLQRGAEWLQRTLDVFAVSVGEIGGPGMDEIQVLAFARRDGAPGPGRYQLAGTPCIDVITREDALCLVADAKHAYPDDRGFQDNDIRGYAGVPLVEGGGRVFGLICVFDDKPIDDNQGVVELIRWFAIRMSAEARLLRVHRVLADTGRRFESREPEGVFGESSGRICDVLQVTTAYVADWPAETPGEARFLALCHKGEQRHDFDSEPFVLSASPFADLLEADTCFIGSDLQSVSPEGSFAQVLGLESCFAVVVKSPAGERIGHIGLAHSRAMASGVSHSAVFSLYAGRLAAELQRQRAIREQRELDRVLNVRQKLESLGLMAGHIAHDFNNLLMAILGNANLAADSLGPDSPARRYIQNIETAATSAGDVVSQLLDYAGHKRTQVENLLVNQAVADASRLVELSRHASVTVEYDLEEHVPPVAVDPTQFQQIIINLVLNAAEALSGRAGTIGISAREVVLTERQIRRFVIGRELVAGRYVEIAVADDGIGIDESTLHRIFDPFFSSKPDGRGLGLSAVRGFVEACGGGLAVTSAPGRGTTVRIYLAPVARQALDEAGAEPAQEAGSPLSVLIVDDERQVAETAAAMLKSLDHAVKVCCSCEEALQAAEMATFDCALLDVRMPRVDGWATLRKLRERHPGLPAVMMTGFANETHAMELVSRFGVELLHKPFAQKALVLAVRRAVCSTVPAA